MIGSATFISMEDFARMSFVEMKDEFERGMPRTSFPDLPPALGHHQLLIQGSHARRLSTHRSPPRGLGIPVARATDDGLRSLHTADNSNYEALIALDEGNVRRGVSANCLRQLSASLARQTEVGHECSVCMDKLTRGSRVMRLPCRHFFHASCVSKWFDSNRTCPVCRAEVEA